MKFPAIATTGAMFFVVSVCGCADSRPTLLPSSDPALNKTSAQFAADAVQRHPYKADAPRGGEAIGRAEVGYWLNRLELANLSDEEWTDCEVWVNHKYVVYVPQIPPRVLKRLPFQMLFDESGNYFPLDNNKVRMEVVEVYRDGRMYDMPLHLAD